MVASGLLFACPTGSPASLTLSEKLRSKEASGQLSRPAVVDQGSTDKWACKDIADRYSNVEFTKGPRKTGELAKMAGDRYFYVEFKKDHEGQESLRRWSRIAIPTLRQESATVLAGPPGRLGARLVAPLRQEEAVGAVGRRAVQGARLQDLRRADLTERTFFARALICIGGGSVGEKTLFEIIWI